MDTISNIKLPDTVQCPTYSREDLKSRIVHIGFGAFHRAHQALFTERVLNIYGGDWGICEVSLFSHKLIDTLRQQDHLYSILENGPDEQQAIVVGAIKESLCAKTDGINSVLEKMAEPQVAIVSLTITEKGYCIKPDTGTLDFNNPLIKNDLESPLEPQSAIGVIVEALARRRKKGIAPFSVLSCDNIPNNGAMVKKAILGFAHERDPVLSDWIAENTTFPSTMVDRIVPAVTDESLQEIKNVLGVDDFCGVTCEPFIQWVVEDNFSLGCPEWDKIGVEFVKDVRPYEEMKLRMLNGSHSFLAYLGYLAGYEFISDCMANDAYQTAAYNLMINEQAPTLRVQNTNFEEYAKRLIERYSNSSLKHKTWQIAMDGSQKLPQRLLESIRWHISKGSSFEYLALGVAGWMRYVGGFDDKGQSIDIRDPVLDEISKICQSTEDGLSRVKGLLNMEAIFGLDLPRNPQFIDTVTRCYFVLMNQGAQSAVDQLATKGRVD